MKPETQHRPPRLQPRLEVLAADHAAIVKGDSRVEISGPKVRDIVRWHSHAVACDPLGAAWYLAGVVDALHHDALCHRIRVQVMARPAA
jgi:hypothetical protein